MWRFQLKTFFPGDYFDCSPITTVGEVGVGWQKVVHSVSNETVAKFPRLFGPAHNECLRKENDFKVSIHSLYFFCFSVMSTYPSTIFR